VGETVKGISAAVLVLVAVTVAFARENTSTR
jgi:hypothetical protein